MQYIEHWKVIVIGLTVLYMVCKFAYDNKSKFLTLVRVKKSKPDLEAIEHDDHKAICHLRKRAIQMGNAELIADLKKIDTKFFDIHCEAMKANV